MNELKELLRDAVAEPPYDASDLDAVLGAGRRRVRRRKVGALGGTALAVAAVVALGTLAWPDPTAVDPATGPGQSVPRPEGPVLRLSDAREAVPGEDYRVLAEHTYENLNRAGVEYFDGVTDDGLLLLRDAPDRDDPLHRLALLDPESGTTERLPQSPLPRTDLWPLVLGSDRLVFGGETYADDDEFLARPFVLLYDRAERTWERLTWPELPPTRSYEWGRLGPDGRLYLRVPLESGGPPEGGWPTGPDGDADDSDAEGATNRLWSVSLDDPADIRDEDLTVGSFAFTDSLLVWTDSTGGDAGRVHVRDLASGEERSFDPRTGERCNLLGFGATDEHVVLSQYCGTYAHGGRDDRVQVLTTEGEPVATLQDDGVEGVLASGGEVVAVTSYARRGEGNYAWDLGSGELLRLTKKHLRYAMGGAGPTGDGLFVSSPVNRGRGGTQRLVELTD